MRATGFLAGVGLTNAAFMRVLHGTCGNATDMRVDDNGINQWLISSTA